MATIQYPVVGTRTYYGYSWDAEDVGAWSYTDNWYNSTAIRQGKFVVYSDPTVYSGPAYGHMFFGTGESTPAELAGRTILSARLYLHRDNSSSAGAMPIRLYTSDLTSIPAAGSSSPNGDANTPEIIIGSLARGAGAWFNISTSVAEWVVAGKCLTLYSSSASHALTCYGTASEDYKPVIEITYADIPDPTEAIIPAIGTVTTAEKLFDWSDSTDYIFDSSELSYEFEFSEDGIAWSATVTTDPGVSEHTLNIKTLLSLEPGQYYYNENCKIRIRAKTPLWGDPQQYYYSDWVESAAFTVDYRIAPPAPTVSVDNDAPYEGEEITFTCGRPESYNTHDSEGTVNVLDYQIRYGATTIADETEPVTSETKDVPYTVGELTAGTDLAVSIYARAVDTEGQTSPLSTVLPMTIKRFRAPIVNIANVDRGEETADVAIDIQDTGYAGTQENTQINKIQYDIGAGWVDATLDGWSGLSNSFTITGLDPDTAYTVQVRAVNNPPSGTTLTGKTGEAASESIPEFRAVLVVFKDTVTGEKAVGARKLYLGADFDEELTDEDVAGLKGHDHDTAYFPLAGGKMNGSPIIPAAQRPVVAMTANNAPSPYVASASTEFNSNYSAWHAFNKDYTTIGEGWVSTAVDAAPWLMLKMDKPLYDIVVTIYNRTRGVLVNGPIAGIIYGSNNGTDFTEIGSFSEKDGSISAGSFTVTCNNSDVAYQYVKTAFSDWYKDGENYIAVGEMYVDGKAAMYA